VRGRLYIQGYAVVICLLAVGKFLDTVSGLMQWALLTLETLCNEVGLSVNPDKTELIVFSMTRKLPGFFKSLFFRVTLSRHSSVKYLRVILDTRLTWREHVDVNVRKAYNLL
jgi:hypothetical protein